MMKDKAREIVQELRTVFAGRSNLLDSLIPPVLFIVINAWLGFDYAVWGALAVAVVITGLRLLRRQSLLYALGGFGGVLFAVAMTKLLGRAEGYFLPGMITGGLTMGLCLLSVLAGRPMVAWTSHVVRRWPLAWYWHPQVRPAYSEVTWLWVGYFGLRLLLQLALFRGGSAVLLGVVQIVTGWPATVVLLIVSYLFGTWRLGRLGGPSVEEFKQGVEPPWQGQRRGF